MLLACGLVFLSAVPAFAAPTWSSPVSLSGSGNAVANFNASVAIADGGLGVEAWSETVAGKSVIRVAQHAAGGQWATLPGDISSSLPGDACDPFASIDPAGNALVVWQQWAGPGCNNGNQTILVRDAGGRRCGLHVAAGGGRRDAARRLGAEGARNASGQVVYAWETVSGGNKQVLAAVGSPSGGFGAQQVLATSANTESLYYLTDAIGKNGDAAVQWTDDGPSIGNIIVSVRPHGGTFPASPTPITTNASPATAYGGTLAIDAAGDVLSSYSRGDGTNDHFTSRFRAATNQVWQAAQDIFTLTAPFSGSWVAVGMDDAGNATAAMVQTNFSSATTSPYTRQLLSATRPLGGAWSAVAPLADPLSSADNQTTIAVSPSGAAVVGWGLATPQNSAQAVYRPAGGSFGALTPVGVGTETGVAISPSGDAAMAMQGIGTPADARVAVLDETAPAITSATVPATATTGQPVALTAVASDAWSGLAAGQPSWSFGDGATGAGASVNHTYAKAGTYTVTIGATDGVGLAAAPVAHQIVVTDAAGPPTPASSVAKPAVKLVWKSSRLVGTITLHGAVGARTKLTIAVRRHGAKKNALTSSATTPAGNWNRTLKLPATLLPGHYDVLVSGAGVTSSQTSFAIAAPASGLVSKRYASGPQHGPAATRLSATSDLWAHFTFGTLPKKGLKITTQWTLPSGTTLKANVRPRTTLVEAEVKQLSGKPLPTGTWHCVLRVGKVVVATVTVRLS